MKKLFLYILLIISIISNALAQSENLKVIKATQGGTIDVSDAAYERYQQWSKILKEKIRDVSFYEDYQKLNPAEKKLYNEFSDRAHFWSIETIGCSWYCGGGPSGIKTSSALASQKDNTYIATNAFDDDLSTAWVEGVKGYGIGEYIEFYFRALSPRVTTIEIYNGYYKSEKTWADNSRVKKFKLYVNDRPYAILELQDVKAVQRFEIEPMQSKIPDKDLVLKFEIMEVYKGNKWDDVAISEIGFDGLDVHCFLKGTKITMSNGTTKPIEDLRIGDEVLSYNFEKQRTESAVIIELAQAVHNRLVELDFEGTKIVCTDDHPYYSSSSGWISLNPQKTKIYKNMDKVNRLKIGDKISFLTANAQLSSKTLQNTEFLNTTEQTYTIVKLNKNDNFFAEGFLVGTEELK